MAKWWEDLYTAGKDYLKERSLNTLLLQETFNKNYNRIREFWKKYGW